MATQLRPESTRSEPNSLSFGPLVQAVVLGLLGLALAWASPPADGPALDPPPLLRIDPNTAPAAILTSLPRLGPTRISALLAAHHQRPFASADDLERRVKGIGPATISAMRPYLRFDP